MDIGKPPTDLARRNILLDTPMAPPCIIGTCRQSFFLRALKQTNHVRTHDQIWAQTGATRPEAVGKHICTTDILCANVENKRGMCGNVFTSLLYVCRRPVDVILLVFSLMLL